MDELELLDLIFFGLLVSPLVFWTIASYWNIVTPSEVAKVQYFGRLGELLTSSNGLLGSGLHFVPWFWGIKLVRISKKMQKSLFEKDQDPKVPGNIMSGTMFAVRSQDGQKMFVEAAVFSRFPYDLDGSLNLLIESGVPVDSKEELKEYIEDAIAADLEFIFGQYPYKEVMGGRKNEDLNTQINKCLQEKESALLRRVGFFGNDHTDDTPGTGEFYLRIEFVHLSGKLGESLENVATAKLEAEAALGVAEIEIETAKRQAVAAKSAAEGKAEFINGPIEIGLKRWLDAEFAAAGATTSETKKTLIDQLKKDGDYKRKEESLNALRGQDLAGGGTYNKQEIDVNSAGAPMKDSSLGTIAAGATIIAKAIATAMGGGKNSGGGGNPGKKGKNKKGGGAPKPPVDDEDDDQDDSYKDK